MDDKHGGDSLDDFGFFWVTILIIAVFAAVMYWGVPPFVRWLVLS